jgi:predicted membrane channel-forming protein YqfA (hemolysin III family)
MVVKPGWVIGRALAIVLLLCGSYLAFIAHESSEALGDFTTFFVVSGVILACIGVFGLVAKFKQ